MPQGIVRVVDLTGNIVEGQWTGNLMNGWNICYNGGFNIYLGWFKNGGMIGNYIRTNMWEIEDISTVWYERFRKIGPLRED